MNWLASVCWLGAFIIPSSGSTQTLSIGDKAPPLRIESWLRGSGPRSFNDGNVYIIDFWATWCGPCLTAMPHLVELKNRFRSKGLRVIAITANDKYGNDLASVKAFLANNMDKTQFAVGWDKEGKGNWQGFIHGQTFVNYMQAAKIEAIPCTFLIDRRGRIAYIGTPGMVDDALQKVLDNKFDIEHAAKKYRAIIALRPKLDSYASMLKAGKYDQAYALGWAIATGPGKDDPRTLGYFIADPIVTRTKAVPKKDLELAVFASKRAVELTNSSDPGMLSILAEAYYATKEYDKAIRTLNVAIKLISNGAKSNDDGLRKEYVRLLKEYESAKARRRSTSRHNATWHSYGFVMYR